ncbi:facilitated trehalose transporter Tret1-like isoform X4 [Diorhabda sublineata]|uniref:facilitated trehalose transporter Tret1-like isoform X4 n=1 Tax=Diorhabda sublineata TaxID=1163346 RepID=UPI0024E13837|nr:facilitated trehalose transporter Tret1-like isoform X4 [Diorhabda sublineata]
MIALLVKKMTSTQSEVKKPVIFYARQIIAAITGTLFAISDGMTYGWTSPMIPYLISPDSHIKTTKHEAEWLETALLCGSLGGLPLTIYLVDKFGRKKSLLFASITILIGWLLIALGDKMIYLFIGRFLCGMAGDMAFVACPMYMAEISDQKIRGFLSGMVYIMVHIGTLLVYCLGPYTPYYMTPLLGSFFVITEVLVFYFMPESPYYLLYKKKEKKARKALEFFKPYSNVDEEVIEITKMLERESSQKGRFQDLIFVKSNRKAITIMAVLNSGQHLCGYTVILMNLHLILESAGSKYMDSSHAAIIFASIMLIATGFSSLQVDKYGRRVLLMISSILSGLCVLTLAVYFHLKYLNFNLGSVSWIPIVSVMVYACVFKLGVGIVPIIVTAEIFPTNMKAIGMTMADAMFILGGILAIQIYQIFSRTFHIFVPFYFFGAFGFFVAIFTFFFIPETKGRSLDEIQSILKGEPLQAIKGTKQQEAVL